MDYSQRLKFNASKMTKITDFDLLKLPNFILRKICVSQNDNWGIFNILKSGIFSKIQNSGVTKWPTLQFYTYKNCQSLITDLSAFWESMQPVSSELLSIVGKWNRWYPLQRCVLSPKRGRFGASNEDCDAILYEDEQREQCQFFVCQWNPF